MTDELLSDTAPTEPETPEVTLEAAPDPKTFDFAAFVAGIRPTRRALTIYSRSDLAAERDVLTARIGESQDAKRPAKERAAMQKRLKEITEEIAEAAIDVVVEARSEEWRNRLNKALVDDGVDDTLVRTSHIIAEQVVEPEGVTGELLEQIRKVSEPQWIALTHVTAAANKGEGVTPDFSRGRSATSRR